MSLTMCVPALALAAWAAATRGADQQLAPLAAAKAERGSLRDACFQEVPFERLTPVTNCIAGSTDSPPVLVIWGDSHADQLSPLMQALAATSPDTPVVVRAFAACPPLAHYPDPNPRERVACSAFNAAVLAEISELSTRGLRGVVLAGRWLRVFRAPQLRQMDSDPAGLVPALKAPGLAESLEAVVEQLSSLGLKVLIVAPIPEMRYDVPYCLARRAPSDCDVERSVIERQRRDVMEILVAIQDHRANVRIFDAIDALCDATTCYARRGDLIVFRDDDHLTPSASRGLLPYASGSLAWLATQD
jgi:hypothetical protein